MKRKTNPNRAIFLIAAFISSGLLFAATWVSETETLSGKLACSALILMVSLVFFSFTLNVTED